MKNIIKIACWALILNFCFEKFAFATISLLSHQKKVIDYLNQNEKLNGLILYHALGAGKTITALCYAKQQNLKTVILVPNALKAHWLKELKKVGLEETSVELLSYNNFEDLTKIRASDFSKSLVIIDEIQKFVELIRMAPNSIYLDTYWQLTRVGKILLLTGTPVFNDAADVAFIGNLVTGQEIFPYHLDEFKSKYMRIDTDTSLFRGYFTESKLMFSTLPLYASFLGLSLVVVSGTGLVLPVIAMAGTSGLNYINEQFPINKVSFRKFDASLFADFANKYISYYEAIEEDKKDYPSTDIHIKKCIIPMRK